MNAHGPATPESVPLSHCVVGLLVSLRRPSRVDAADIALNSAENIQILVITTHLTCCATV